MSQRPAIRLCRSVHRTAGPTVVEETSPPVARSASQGRGEPGSPDQEKPPTPATPSRRLSEDEWQEVLRVARVIELMRSDDLEAKELASRAGFATPADLELSFVRWMGLPPQVYRHSLRRRHPNRPDTRRKLP